MGCPSGPAATSAPPEHGPAAAYHPPSGPSLPSPKRSTRNGSAPWYQYCNSLCKKQLKK